MAANLFREKTLNRISSPEELDGYIRVARPSVWLLLGALIAILAGFCVWGFFGRLETVLPVHGMAEDGKIMAVLSGEEIGRVKTGMEVDLNHTAVGVVKGVSVKQDGSALVELYVGELEDGSYDLTILVESIQPMYFILN